MVEFEVKDLSCDHCVSTVTRAIRQEDPAAKVRVDLATKRVSVESAAPEPVLRAALRDAGYPAS